MDGPRAQARPEAVHTASLGERQGSLAPGDRAKRIGYSAPRSLAQNIRQASGGQKMRTIFAILGLLAISQPGCAPAPSNDIVPFPGSEPPIQELSAGYTLETPIEVIVANPRGEAVINKYMPKLLSNPMYGSFKGMNLKTLAMFSRGEWTDEKMALVKADLGALSPDGK